jgi:hypothetical protein
VTREARAEVTPRGKPASDDRQDLLSQAMHYTDGHLPLALSVCPPPSCSRSQRHDRDPLRGERLWLACPGFGEHLVFPDDHWQWVALSDVGGGNARGHLTEYDASTGTGFSADVACLTVAANSARMGLIVKESTNPSYPVGVGKYIHVTETGQGANEVDEFLPDAASYAAVDPLTFRPLSCPSPVAGGYPWDGTMNVRG